MGLFSGGLGGLAKGLIGGVLFGGIGSILGFADGLFGDDPAEEARKEAEKRAEEARRIAMDKKPEEESATISFGSDDSDFGNYGDFLIPKSSSSGLASTGKSGLGF